MALLDFLPLSFVRLDNPNDLFYLEWEDGLLETSLEYEFVYVWDLIVGYL